MSYLKEEMVFVKGVGELALRELNALGQREMMKAHAEADMVKAMAWAVKYGTTKFRDKEPEEIMDELSMKHLQNIAEAVSELSDLGDEAKNSESGLSDVSSSA